MDGPELGRVDVDVVVDLDVLREDVLELLVLVDVVGLGLRALLAVIFLDELGLVLVLLLHGSLGFLGDVLSRLVLDELVILTHGVHILGDLLDGLWLVLVVKSFLFFDHFACLPAKRMRF